MKYKVYHGSGQEFEQFMVDKARVINDHYGGVLYFTDNANIAKRYASAWSKKTGKRVIYSVELDIKHLFDIQKMYDGKEVKKIIGSIPLEKFARNAGLLIYGSDKYEIISHLKIGHMSLSGDVIFRGISGGHQKTLIARNILKRAGYDGLKYYGDKIGSISPAFYLPYDHNAVHILGHEQF